MKRINLKISRKASADITSYGIINGIKTQNESILKVLKAGKSGECNYDRNADEINIQVALADTEYKRYKKAALDCGLTFSNYLYYRLLSGIDAIRDK